MSIAFAETSTYREHAVAYPEGREAVANVLIRSVASFFGEYDPVIGKVLVLAVETFAAYGGDSDAAAKRMAPHLSGIGARHARQGRSLRDLDLAFGRARESVSRSIVFAINCEAPAYLQHYVRAKTGDYVRSLHRHALLGWHRVNSKSVFHRQLVHTPITDSPRVDANRPTAGDSATAGDAATVGDAAMRLARPSDAHWLQAVTEVDGIPPRPDGYRVVAATGDSVSAAIFDHHDVVSAEDPREVLVPATWSDDDIIGLARCQVVVSAAVDAGEVTDAAQLVHQAAELVAAGVVHDERNVIPCHDHLGLLVLHSSPQLCQLLVAKHLAGWEAMTAVRRVNLGETLLAWLELGQPVNAVSRYLQMAPQTVHSRLRNARNMMGDSLTDPRERLEIILALQTMLPQWKTEAR